MFRRIWALPAALTALALAVRWPLLDTPLYGDEAVHFYIARHLASQPSNIFPPSDSTRVLFWQRPFFALQLWPGAVLGLTALRVLHSLIAAASVPLAWAIVRRAAAPTWAQTLAPMVLAVHPALVPWGVVVFADALVATWLLAALAAWLWGHRSAAAGLAIMAAWTKEIGYLALAVGAGVTLMEGMRGKRLSAYPLRLDKPVTLWFGASLVAVAPMAYALYGLDGRMTGWSTAPLGLPLWITMAGTLPVALLLTASLGFAGARTWAGIGLAYAAAFAFYGWVLQRGVDGWYAVTPLTLATVASAVVAGRLASRWPSRAWPAVALALIVASPAALAVLPGDASARSAWTIDAVGENLAEQQDRMSGDDHLLATLDVIDTDEVVLLADPAWFNIFYPFADRQRFVGYAWTDSARNPREWTAAMENASVTVVHKIDRSLNVAIREVFADCLRMDNERYAVIDNAACPGRRQRLEDAAAARGWEA